MDPYQYPEKLIPTLILNAIEQGMNYQYMEMEEMLEIGFMLMITLKQFCEFFLMAKLANVYNIGGNAEKTNLEVANAVCDSLDNAKPKNSGSYREQITFVEDRPGHDRRYAIDCTKIKTELGWNPKMSFESGIDRNSKVVFR